MNIIIRKVRVLAAPFVGTEFFIELPEGQTQWSIYHVTTAGEMTVDWGDGVTEVVEGNSITLSHEYAVPGSCRVRFSDAMNLLTMGTSEEYKTLYNPCLRRFVTNAQNYHSLGIFAFSGCVNLESFDISGSGVYIMNNYCFKGCSGLKGDVYLPGITSCQFTTSSPFSGCTGGIASIHFTKVLEERVTQSAVYQTDPTLGTGTAVCVFDL